MNDRFSWHRWRINELLWTFCKSLNGDARRNEVTGGTGRRRVEIGGDVVAPEACARATGSRGDGSQEDQSRPRIDPRARLR